MHLLPVTESEIDAFLLAFESGTLAKERWTHQAHIFSGACYVDRLGEAAAIEHMRGCIQRYNEAVGGKNTASSGYHETVTVFWMKLLARFRGELETASRAAFASAAVERFAADRGLLGRYYDYDVVGSTVARRTWVPPNLGPL